MIRSSVRLKANRDCLGSQLLHWPVPCSTIRHMLPRHRTVVLTFVLPSLIGCENPFANGAPADSPGVAVPGLSGVCPTNVECAVWSADSKTLFVVASGGPSSPSSLIAVDPATLTYRSVGAVAEPALKLTPSADGSAMYFVGPDRTGNSGWTINRMSLSDGLSTVVAKTALFDYLVSPDGTTLAYHLPGGTSAIDTTVLLDVRLRTRRATMIGGFGGLSAFSPDGTLLAMNPLIGGTLNIWHVTTGVVDTISVGRGHYELNDIAWSGGNFRLLFVDPYFRTFTDSSLAGGNALTYVLQQGASRIAWLPDRSAIWLLSEGPICGPADCHSVRFDIHYADATQTLTLGAARSNEFLMVAASPDGRWIAHSESLGSLYLLRSRVP